MKPGLRLESLRFPARPDLVHTSTATFAIVPTSTIVDDRGERTESLHYQFGVQPIGAPGFRYIGGTAINAGNVREMFPDFPADYVFPRTHRKKL